MELTYENQGLYMESETLSFYVGSIGDIMGESITVEFRVAKFEFLVAYSLTGVMPIE